MSPSASAGRKPFIIDIDARIYGQSKKKDWRFDLSPKAQRVYTVMRKLANGQTGHLGIRGTPLDWKYISRQAKVGRDGWQEALRELIEKGWVRKEREEIEIWCNGRKRKVWGRCHYWVHRQPQAAQSSKVAQKPCICPVPDPSAAEESGTQISSETPNRSTKHVRDGGFQSPSSGRDGQSSSPTVDDLKKSFLSKCSDPSGTIATILEVVAMRAEKSGVRIQSENYFQVAVQNFDLQTPGSQDREEFFQRRREAIKP